MQSTVSDVHIRFGQRIRELRKEKGFSQEKLADDVGVDRSYMGFVERGERNPTLTILAKIAKTFNIPLSELFQSV